ncbi:hypothetical protein BKA70DRAFT_74194 [Coprinopsis sp. MPI-PUGE-AT-0042]|nr:hypothetical protein BKA70DRAFT_74194 [Coprinopsis sp. MPI-PUGE-AT-0042]
MEFLWVRWMAVNTKERKFRFGWKAKQLPRVGFLDPRKDDTPIYGFVDPAEVIRGIHLIPDSISGTSTNGIPKTIARRSADNGVDVNWFYVAWFADRDLFMRYRGGGIGHTATREATDHFLQDRDGTDVKFLGAKHQSATVNKGNDENVSSDEESEDGGDAEGGDQGEVEEDDDGNRDVESQDGGDEGDDTSEADEGDNDVQAGEGDDDDDAWNSDIEALVDHEMEADGEFLSESEDEWEEELFGGVDNDEDEDNGGSDEDEGNEDEDVVDSD